MDKATEKPFDVRTREREEQYRCFFENSPDSIFVEDERGIVLTANPAACALLELTLEELIGMHALNLVPETERENVARSFRQWFSGEQASCESYTRTASGRVVPVAITGRRISYNDRPAVLLHVRDSTRRREMEKELRLHDSILQTMAEGVCLVRPRDGCILYANPTFERMFGYGPGELNGRPVALLNYGGAGTSPEEVARHIAAMLETNGAADYEVQNVRKDGTPFWSWAHTSTFEHPEHGTIWVAVHQDITQRKAAEATLRQLSARLLRLQDEERRRIACELHDATGQKLAAIAMNLSSHDAAFEQLPVPARKAVRDSSHLVEECAQEIRTLSYLLHPPLLDERGLAFALRWFIEGFTERSGIAVHLDLPADLPRLSRDVELALFRIVQEALTNVHRHSGSSTAKIQLHADARSIRLRLEDAGKGFAECSRDGQPILPGVGVIGMRERVKQLRGQIQIDSSPAGTVVEVVLPAEEAPP